MKNAFLNKSGQIAVIGVSKNKNKFGHQVYKTLRDKDYPVVPVHPTEESILDDTCYNSIDALPSTIDKAIVVTSPNETDKILRQLAEKGIRKVWVQQMAQSKESKAIAESLSMDAIFNQCVLMYAEPVKGIHGFHRWLWTLLGLSKKEIPL